MHTIQIGELKMDMDTLQLFAGLAFIFVVSWILFSKKPTATSTAAEEAKPETTTYKVPEPAATTPIQLVVEAAPEPVAEVKAKPAKKPAAKKPAAAKKTVAVKKPAAKKAPAKKAAK